MQGIAGASTEPRASSIFGSASPIEPGSSQGFSTCCSTPRGNVLQRNFAGIEPLGSSANYLETYRVYYSQESFLISSTPA